MTLDEQLATALRNLMIATRAEDEARENLERAAANTRSVWEGANAVLGAYDARRTEEAPNE